MVSDGHGGTVANSDNLAITPQNEIPLRGDCQGGYTGSVASAMLTVMR